MSLRDKFYYLGPVVKPRDDKFLRFFILRFFLYRHPGAGRDPLRRAGICVAFATALITWGPVSSTGMTQENRVQSAKFKVQMLCRCATALLLLDCHGRVAPRDDKILSVLAYRTFITHGMTNREHGA